MAARRRFESRLATLPIVLALLTCSGVTFGADLERIRISHTDGATRVVLDLADVMRFRTGQASEPSRFFIDLFDASIAEDFDLGSASTPLLKGIRTGKHKASHVRVVLDLHRQLNVNTTIVGPSGSQGHRLVVDVSEKNGQQGTLQTDTVPADSADSGSGSASRADDADGIRKVRNDRAVKAPLESKVIGRRQPEKVFQQRAENVAETLPVNAPTPAVQTSAPAQVHTAQQINDETIDSDGAVPSDAAVAVKEDRVIVVDPGHGGKDPGAVGRRNTYEKDVVLAIARHVAAEVNEIPGYRAIMTRDDDTFVALRERAEIARENHAYAFISIHADGSKRASAKGSSVYSLTDGAKTNARTKKLARHLNANDVVQDESVAEENANNRNLVDTLMALSTAKTQELGFDLGKAIMQELKKVTTVNISKVEKANFRVLLAPGVPTILVETGFITNPKEEKLLRSKTHQKATAKAIVAGLKKFLKENESKLTNAEGQQTRG